jgi:hypothetical protein
MTDLYRTIYTENPNTTGVIDLTFYSLPSTHFKFATLSEAQRLLSSILLLAENDLIEQNQQQLLWALLLWMAVVAAGAVVVWGYNVRQFLEELNDIKSILGILPISLVRRIPLALKYIIEILEKRKDLC